MDPEVVAPVLPEEVVIPEKDYGYRNSEDVVVVDDPAPINDDPAPVDDAPAPAAPAAPFTPVAETPDWKATIKGVDKYEALEALGYDKFSINLLKYREKTGNVTPYLEVKSVDYEKMSPEQIMKVSLQKSNPGMSVKALEFKFNKELREKYYLDRDDYPENSDEAIYGEEQMRLDAEQQRKALIAEQNDFKAPEVSADLQDTAKQAQLQQQRAEIGNKVVSDDATVKLKESKALTFGKGEASFSYPIPDVQGLIDTALSTILSSGRTDLNGVNIGVFYKQLAYGQDPEAFEREFAKHHQAIGRKGVQSGLQNIAPPVGTIPDVTPDLTPAQQLRMHGRLV